MLTAPWNMPALPVHRRLDAAVEDRRASIDQSEALALRQRLHEVGIHDDVLWHTRRQRALALAAALSLLTGLPARFTRRVLRSAATSARRVRGSRASR